MTGKDGLYLGLLSLSLSLFVDCVDDGSSGGQHGWARLLKSVWRPAHAPPPCLFSPAVLTFILVGGKHFWLKIPKGLQKLRFKKGCLESYARRREWKSSVI